MNRKEKILTPINRLGKGLEVGPSHTPVAPKSEGFDVEILDKDCQSTLQEKYRPRPHVDINNIEEVDYVWSGESYAALTGNLDYYDWIIASHVIEHVPNFVGFLNDCAEIMKADGVLSLVVPDKRYCFDQFRPLTSLSQIIDTYDAGLTGASRGTVLEEHMRRSNRDGLEAWGNHALEAVNSLDHDLEIARQIVASNPIPEHYYDVHVSCFTPSSFRLLILELYLLGLTEFKEVAFYPSEGCEFFVALSKQGGEPKLDRLQLMEAVQEELANPYLLQKPKLFGLFKR
jgi:hypothetical protein